MILTSLIGWSVLVSQVSVSHADLSIAAYNVWHGHGGTGFLEISNLEPKGRKQRRIAFQIEEFRKLAPDLLFLEELDPVGKLAKRYASELGMDQIHQADNCGMKIGGLGFPFNFFSGIGILAKPELHLRRLGSKKLSGPSLCGCSDDFGFQTGEFRYALAGEITHPDYGKLLVVVAHIHHGLELNEAIETPLLQLLRLGYLNRTQYGKFRERVQAEDDRRLHEVAGILKLIKKYRTPEHRGVILAGDFNSISTSPSQIRLRDAGFTDSFGTLHPEELGYTWNREVNPNIYHYGVGTIPATSVDGLGLGKDAKKHLSDAVRNADTISRRIDYIFTTEELAALLQSSEVIMDYAQSDDLFGSDHFGLNTVLGDRAER
jgi:endonuclease/exonuclease/phosphatase family metal-dependent hydrolase